jgi:hypothetical protein
MAAATTTTPDAAATATVAPAAPAASPPAPAPTPAVVLPATFTLAAPCAWFDKNGVFWQANAGDVITDAAQIAYLVGRGG